MPVVSFTPFPVLFTEHLLLRELNLNDAPAIFSLRSDELVNKYLDRVKAKSIHDAEDFIRKINSGVRANQCMFWAICLKGQVNLCGTICLWNFSEQENKFEIGYELLPQFQGKGIMQEAITRIIEYGFYTLQLDRIEAWTLTQNTSSIKILERNRFERDFGAESKMDRTVEGPDMTIYALRKKFE